MALKRQEKWFLVAVVFKANKIVKVVNPIRHALHLMSPKHVFWLGEVTAWHTCDLVHVLLWEVTCEGNYSCLSHPSDTLLLCCYSACAVSRTELE